MGTNSKTNVKNLRHGVSELLATVQKNQTCKADVQKLAGQLSRVVSQVDGLRNNLRKPNLATKFPE